MALSLVLSRQSQHNSADSDGKKQLPWTTMAVYLLVAKKASLEPRGTPLLQPAHRKIPVCMWILMGLAALL